MTAEVINKDGLFVYQCTHRIVYNTKKPVPISEVIHALQGLQTLLKTIPKVMTGLTGANIESSEFELKSLESGSLIEDVIVRFFFKDQEQLNKFVDKTRDNGIVKNTIVAVAIAGLVGYGISLATGNKPATNITANNNVIINIGAGEVQMTPEQFSAIVKTAVGSDRKSIAESALKFIAPARADEKSTITFGSDKTGDPIQLTAAAIVEAPRTIELAKNERVEEFKNVRLVIRAVDLDSRKTGWAGRISNRDERLKIELDPSVSESDLFGKSEVNVDAALVFTEQKKSRELLPSRIYVRRVIK